MYKNIHCESICANELMRCGAIILLQRREKEENILLSLCSKSQIIIQQWYTKHLSIAANFVERHIMGIDCMLHNISKIDKFSSKLKENGHTIPSQVPSIRQPIEIRCQLLGSRHGYFVVKMES